jgi:hypothetical protein
MSVRFEVDFRRLRLLSRRISVKTALLSCVLSVGLATAAGGVAIASGLPLGRTIKPGPPVRIAGYGLACQSTARTPNFSCEHGQPYGKAGVPIITVFKGIDRVTVQSRSRPSLSYSLGYWTTTVRR